MGKTICDIKTYASQNAADDNQAKVVIDLKKAINDLERGYKDQGTNQTRHEKAELYKKGFVYNIFQSLEQIGGGVEGSEIGQCC